MTTVTRNTDDTDDPGDFEDFLKYRIPAGSGAGHTTVRLWPDRELGRVGMRREGHNRLLLLPEDARRRADAMMFIAGIADTELLEHTSGADAYDCAEKLRELADAVEMADPPDPVIAAFSDTPTPSASIGGKRSCNECGIEGHVSAAVVDRVDHPDGDVSKRALVCKSCAGGET